MADTNLTSLFTNIANAIRTKSGSSAQITASDFPTEIINIPSGGITPSGDIEITENGTFDVTNFANALVNVQGGGEESPFEYGEFTPTADVSQYVIEHGRETNPTVIVVYEPELAKPYAMRIYTDYYIDSDNGYVHRGAITFNGYNSRTMGALTNTGYTEPTYGDGEVTVPARNSTYMFMGGITYKYVLIFDE